MFLIRHGRSSITGVLVPCYVSTVTTLSLCYMVVSCGGPRLSLAMHWPLQDGLTPVWGNDVHTLGNPKCFETALGSDGWRGCGWCKTTLRDGVRYSLATKHQPSPPTSEEAVGTDRAPKRRAERRILFASYVGRFQRMRTFRSDESW